MSDLKTALREIGATNQQLASPVVAYCEKALAENRDLVAGISEARADEIISKIKDAGKSIANIEKAIAAGIINRETADAVIAYRKVLEATKEVFGKDCSQDVICKAIETGSYIAWRGIMGSKQEGVTRRI